MTGYTEAFEIKEAAHKRELEIKKKKSRKYIEWLIGSAGQALAVPMAIGNEVVPPGAGCCPQ